MHKIRIILGGPKKASIHHQIGVLHNGAYVVGPINVGDEIPPSERHPSFNAAFEAWKAHFIKPVAPSASSN